VARGLITADVAAGLSQSECVDLIFIAGVSTAEKVTDVSGRGVGMDIVRSNIENLGGSIRVETHAGQGTAFLIRLPLTIAIIQGLLVASAGVVCVLPMSAVVETLRLPVSEIHTVARREVVRLRNRIVPLLRLNRVLGRNQMETIDEEGRQLIIVVSSGKEQVALVVDEIMEPQEIVVKPLGSYLGISRESREPQSAATERWP
jgi:two-component system chemotaxis sensor kinase CheA